jgi:CheY-like chemotaxis protein
MNSILGMTELALDAPLTAPQRDCLEAVRHSVRSLAAILESRELPPGRGEPQVFEPREVVRRAVKAARIGARRAGLALTSHCACDVPMSVLGRCEDLERVILDVVDARLEKTAAGGVHVETEYAAGSLQFTITDTSRASGDPLDGLRPAVYAVQDMGGYLVAESVDGVAVTLRLAVAVLSAPVSGSLRPAARTMKILVAEDNNLNRQAAAGILRKAGHVVEFAADGEQALHKALAGGYDAVLMDLDLPRMNGIEATRRLRAAELEGRYTPVIAFTAYAMASQREECIRAGMDDFIAKPAESRTLLAKLTYWGATAA